jgi:hypothetical protein
MISSLSTDPMSSLFMWLWIGRRLLRLMTIQLVHVATPSEPTCLEYRLRVNTSTCANPKLPSSIDMRITSHTTSVFSIGASIRAKHSDHKSYFTIPTWLSSSTRTGGIRLTDVDKRSPTLGVLHGSLTPIQIQQVRRQAPDIYSVSNIDRSISS